MPVPATGTREADGSPPGAQPGDGAAASGGGESARAGAVIRAVAAAPDLVAAAVAGFCIGPMALMLAGHFSGALAAALGVVGSALAVAVCGLRTEFAARVDVRWTLVAAAVVLVWLVWNLHYTAEDVYATRDPAAYTISGQWLTNHPSLQIATHPEIFGNPPGGEWGTGSYAVVDRGGILNGQGNHLLPVLLGVSGSVFGVGALLATNTVLTALALFVFFGFARRVVGPRLALVAMTAFAVSMPVIYVGRDSYTESLAMLFVVGSLAFVHRAHTSGRLADWLLAGLLGGLVTCARVDGYLALVGLVAAGAAVAALAPPGLRSAAVRRSLALAGGAALPVVLGWIDLTHVSRQYYHAQHGNIVHLLAALGVAVLVAPVFVLAVWRTSLGRWLATARARRRTTRALTALIVLAFAALATRPAWQITRGPRQLDLENMQRRWGVPVDGTRTYNEQTVHWLAMYYGWPTVVLAAAGYVLLVRDLLLRGRRALVALLTAGLATSALYLWTSEVAPDQPWAMRRYVPVVLPVLLVAACVAIGALWRQHRARRLMRGGAIAGVIAMIAIPAAVSWPMRSVREEVPQRAQLEAICTAVGRSGAVVEVDAATIFGYGQSIRSFCNVPAIGLTSASTAQIAEMSRAVRATGRTLFVLGQNPDETGGQPGRAFDVVIVQRWPTQINKAPRQPDQQQYAVWLSQVGADGVLRPVPPVRSGP
ncbi:MAG: hypothetical protein QOE97_2858 [Pseudonocardiales bacterium]|nr:hypothetical protein [Pseudonocardiales bacterium]